MTTIEFVRAVQAGEFLGRVLVDNDSVIAIVDLPGDEFGDDFDEIHDFEGEGPEGALIAVLEALGTRAERA